MGPITRTLYLISGIIVVLFLAMGISLLGTCTNQHGEGEQERLQDLAALAQSACERAEVVDELLAGRRSLFEAAARFRHLSAESPVDLMHYLRTFHPDRNDDELHYLHVMMYVQAHCRRHGTSEAIVESFRQEFEARRMSGTLTVEEPESDGQGRQPS